MNRLLQGDVGSGKTLVAAYAMLAAVANKLQAALLAPTAILAEQHMRTLSRYLEGSKVRLALVVGHRAGALFVPQHGDAALHRRPRSHGVVPALDVRVVGQVDVAELGVADPGEGDDVGHAVFVAGEPGGLGQALIEHAVQPRHFVGVAVDGVGDFLDRIVGEVVVLTEHRADAAHLEHHPFQAFIAPERILRDQLAAGLFRQIDHDGG